MGNPPSGAGNDTPPGRNRLEDVSREDVLLEALDDVPVVGIGHVRVAGCVRGLARGQQGRGRRRGELVGETLERLHGAVVAAALRVDHQDEPLPPMVEHDRAIDQQETDRRDRRLGRVRRRMPVQ